MVKKITSLIQKQFKTVAKSQQSNLIGAVSNNQVPQQDFSSYNLKKLNFSKIYNFSVFNSEKHHESKQSNNSSFGLTSEMDWEQYDSSNMIDNAQLKSKNLKNLQSQNQLDQYLENLSLNDEKHENLSSEQQKIQSSRKFNSNDINSRIRNQDISEVQQRGDTPSNVTEDYRQIRLGFIGVGTISKSMVKGLCNPSIEDKRASNIILSPRNKQNVEELNGDFDQVTIAKSNQEVIDNSDWVIVGLLTTQMKTVLKDLKFRKDQTIINLAAMPNEKFLECVDNYKQVVRACPLPPIALNVGATIVSPSNPDVEFMFDALGSSVAVETSHETYSLQGIACLMGPQYAIFQATYDWMVNKQNIDAEIAKKYIIGTYHSICVDAMNKVTNENHSFEDLVKEQTPGGLNEQNLKYLDQQGVNQHFKDVLDRTYQKMTQKK